MSNAAEATKTSDAKGLIDIREQIKRELAEVRKSVAPPATNRISTKDKKFTLPGNRVHTGPLRAVVLDHRNLNRYYTQPYNANNPIPPDCFAIAKAFDDLSPANHDGVKSPQADDCASCPRNQWKSAPNGKGKACRNMVRLALAATSSEEEEILTLEIPPTGLKNWAALVSELETIGKLPIQVIVDIEFDEAMSYPVPKFKAVDIVEDLEHFWELREKAQALLDQAPSTD